MDVIDILMAKMLSGGSGGGGLTDEAKQALLACFANVAWMDTDEGQDLYDALETALYPPATLVSITAVFNQGSNKVYPTDTLDSLKQYLTVRANYSNGTSQPVTTYVLSGTLTLGTSVITVTYGGKTTTFNVTVTEPVVVENFTRIGNPTIEDGILTPSSDSWIETPTAFSGSDPWEITLKMYRPTIRGAYEIFAQSSGIKVRSAWQSATTTAEFYDADGTNIFPNGHSASKSVPQGVWTWIKFAWNGQKYDCGVSTDGENYVWVGNSTTPFNAQAPRSTTSIKTGILQIGSSSTDAQFDLNECKIEINGEVWWTPYAVE